MPENQLNVTGPHMDVIAAAQSIQYCNNHRGEIARGYSDMQINKLHSCQLIINNFVVPPCTDRM